MSRRSLISLLFATLAIAGWVVLVPVEEAAAGPDRNPSGAPAAHGFLPIPSEVPADLASPASALHSASLAAPPTSPLAATFEREVDAIVARWIERAGAESKGRATRQNVRVAVHVVEAERGALLVSRDADEALRPASNMKLVTSAAALVLLGPDWNFETSFDALPTSSDTAAGADPLQGGVLVGDLVVRAAGDPLYAPDGLGRSETRLDEVVRALRERGLERVTGNVVLDEGSFPDPGPGPEWPPANQFWQSSCALAGGFSINGGMLHATVRAGSAGARASVAVHPSPHGLRSKYGVETVNERINDVRVGANSGGVTVGGRIGRSVGTVEADFAHPDPVAHFGAVLLDRFARGGVRIEGKLVRQRAAPPGTRLATLRSPLRDTLAPILRDSVNSVSDQVFFATAQATLGTADREAGRRATARALTQLGVSDEGLVQVDGSGLSRANRVTARQLTALVGAALETEHADLFRSSLAVAGRSGTLEKRMRDTAAQDRVEAKTGWIRGASSLSGVAQNPAGKEYLFSILVAYPADLSGLNTRCFKPLQDELVVALVELGS